MFNESLINCQAILSNINFETPAKIVAGTIIPLIASRKIKFNTRDLISKPDNSSTEYQELDFLYPELVIG